MIVDATVGLAVGLATGLVFFGGLRWTLDRLQGARRPVILALASVLVRIVVVAGALVAVAGGSVTRVLFGLAGILIVRTVMVARVRRELDAMEGSPWT